VAPVTAQVYVAAEAALEAPVEPDIGPAVAQVAAGAFTAPVPVSVHEPVPVGTGNGPWTNVGVSVAVKVKVAGLFAVAGLVELTKVAVGVFFATTTWFEDEVRVTAAKFVSPG